MLYDLAESSLSGEFALLYAQIRDAYQRLGELVADMNEAELHYAGPAGTDNCTAAILLHLAVGDADMAARWAGVTLPAGRRERLGPGRDEAGRLPAPPAGWTAGDSLAALDEIHGHLRTTLAGMSPADLERRSSFRKVHEVTLRWALWHMAEHSMLHQGQIRVLKRQARSQ